MLSITNTPSAKLLETTKKEIRSILISKSTCDITLCQLNREYKNILDVTIPFEEFHYTSLEDFLRSMPDVVQLRHNENNELCAYHIDTEKTKHITKLVSKNKKRNCSKQLKLQYCYNYLDPHVLCEILQEFIMLGIYKIKKNDILSKIENRLASHTFYTMKDLDNQLYELHHLLFYNDYFVYLKNDFFTINHKKLKEQESITQTSKFVKDTKKIPTINPVGAFIKDITKSRLEKLMVKHVNGIWCTELPKIYCNEYGVELEYKKWGFNSVIEFVTTLPDIMQIIKTSNTVKMLIVSAKASAKDIKDLEMKLSILQVFNSQKNIKNDEFILEPTLTTLSSHVSETLFPKFALGIDEVVHKINVTSLVAEKSIPVIISEIYDPSFFWIRLRKNSTILSQLMSDMQEFYNSIDLEKYKIPSVLVDVGLNIVCLYAKLWHRGKIKKVTNDKVIVSFYDFGSVKKYNINNIYFLDKKFSIERAQAIRCSLYNVKPIGMKKWPNKVTNILKNKILDKVFIISVLSIEDEMDSMIINLIHITKDKYKIYINEWMVENKLAEWKEPASIQNNITFKHYRECVPKKQGKINDESCTEKCLEKPSFTKNYISIDDKVKALNYYLANELYNR